MNFRRLWQTFRLNCQKTAPGRANYLRSKNIFGLIGSGVAYSARKVPLYPKLIKIHDNVNIAANVTFITHDVSDSMINNIESVCANGQKLCEKIGCIEIMENVFVGANSTILYDVRIGSNVIIGAGSIVTKDIPPNSVAAGVPAKVIGNFDEFVSKRLTWSGGGYSGCQPPVRGVSVPDETAEFFWKKFNEVRNADK